MRPEPMANEVLLLHNITESNAAQILRHSFDERLARTNLYGHGVHFTTEACKAAVHKPDATTADSLP